MPNEGEGTARDGARSKTSLGIEKMTPESRASLASLLDASRWLSTLCGSLALRGCDLEAMKLAGIADRIAVDACRLAGLEVELGPNRKQVELLSLEVERHNDKSWTGRVEAFSEKAVGVYFDAPTRPIAVAMGLMTLARTVLDCAPDNTGYERELEALLAQTMTGYDEALDAGTPELSCHGEHFD
jgi:hypothetical protein